jgi:hypothetical protein
MRAALFVVMLAVAIGTQHIALLHLSLKTRNAPPVTDCVTQGHILPRRIAVVQIKAGGVRLAALLAGKGFLEILQPSPVPIADDNAGGRCCRLMLFSVLAVQLLVVDRPAGSAQLVSCSPFLIAEGELAILFNEPAVTACQHSVILAPD